VGGGVRHDVAVDVGTDKGCTGSHLNLRNLMPLSMILQLE
jgi:hypothetical protein